MWRSMTSFGTDEALLHLREATVDYEHALVVNNETQRQRNFKRYQESLEPHEMCVVAAGNHGFGFRLPSPVVELLGSLFTVTLMLDAKSPSTVEVQSPKYRTVL